MAKTEEKRVFKAAVVVTDKRGLPNYMTMFYMEPGTYKEEDVSAMFKIKGKIVPAILISQFHNVMLRGVPISLPYQQPKHSIEFDDAAKACRKKGKGWHLMTNTEFVYLLHEAEALGHVIGGNTNFGKNAKNPEEKGVLYESGRTLTGCDTLTWSHDGTKNGVFGINGNFCDMVAGLRLHNGIVEYIKDNDAAAEDYGKDAEEWEAAEVDGKQLKLCGSLDEGGVVLSTAEEIEESCEGCHISELQLKELEEVPEIAYRLGIVPHDWKNETAGIWADSELEETVPLRGSSSYCISKGGSNYLCLSSNRFAARYDASFRSALYLEDWQLVTEILAATAIAHAE